MSETTGTPVLAQIRRVAILFLGLAPVVAIGLIGVTRLQHDTPDWVYWEAELILLIALKIAYQITVCLSLLGTIVLGFLFARGLRGGKRRSWSWVSRGVLLCVALLLSVTVSECVCAGWISWAHRSTTVPVGGLGTAEAAAPRLRFSYPMTKINLRSNFSDPPGDREIDLVVIGGSSAQGVPFDRWVSIGQIVAWKLQEAIPKRPVRLKVVARAGDLLETQHKLLSRLQRRPDLVLIYSGHNEFFSRLSWARNTDHYVSDKRPSRWAVFIDHTEQFSPFCSLINESAAKCRIAIPPAPENRRDLVDVPSYTALEFTTICTDFRWRLEQIASYVERLGGLPVLIVPPGNDADFEPNRSYLPPETPKYVRDEFKQEFLAARKSESSDPAAAIERYRALVARQPCFAESHYRLGLLLEQAGLWDEAYQEYVAARDLDGLPMRCLSPLQQMYRQVAARHGWILIDGQMLFHAIGRHGLLDDELFEDAMHPSLRGQIALAQAVLIALRERSVFGWPKDSAVPIVDPAECVVHFGIDKSTWRHLAMWCKGFHELISPLRYDNELRMRKHEAGIRAVAKIDAGMPAESVGLPNLGTPAAVPRVAQETLRAPVPSFGVIPCLVE